MLITLSFKKRLIVEQFQGNYLNGAKFVRKLTFAFADDINGTIYQEHGESDEFQHLQAKNEAFYVFGPRMKFIGSS